MLLEIPWIYRLDGGTCCSLIVAIVLIVAKMGINVVIMGEIKGITLVMGKIMGLWLLNPVNVGIMLKIQIFLQIIDVVNNYW